MSKGGSETSLKELFQHMAGESVQVQVLLGIVKSADPLKIQVVGDDKLVIGPNSAYLPRHLTDYETEVTVEWQTEEASAHSHAIEGRKTIQVHNALEAGESVYLLAFNRGKQYYVLDRVV